MQEKKDYHVAYFLPSKFKDPGTPEFFLIVVQSEPLKGRLFQALNKTRDSKPLNRAINSQATLAWLIHCKQFNRAINSQTTLAWLTYCKRIA